MAGATQGHTLIIRIHLDDPDNALRYGVNRVTVLEGQTPEKDDPAAQIHFNCIECQSRYFISPKVIKMTELEIVPYASETFHVKEEPALDLLETRNMVELPPADPLGNVKVEENHIQTVSFDLPDPSSAIRLVQVNAQTDALMNRTKKRPQSRKRKSLVFTCDICNASMKYKGSIESHMKIHLGKRYSCPKCPKSFTRKSHGKVHLERAHKNEFRFCKACNWSQNCTLEEFYSHLRRDHPEIPFRQGYHPRVGDFNGVDYPCIYCEPQKVFSSFEELEVHLRFTHKRRHACKRCPKAFDSPAVIRHHVAVNHEKKTFDCSICDKKFRRKDVLLNHMKKHPEKDPAAFQYQ